MYNILTIARPEPILDRKHQAFLQAGDRTLTNGFTLSVSCALSCPGHAATLLSRPGFEGHRKSEG